VWLYTYDNGIRLLVRPSDASRILAVSARMAGGQWSEPEGQDGINRFVSEVGMRSTRRWDREGFGRLLGANALEASAHVWTGSRANTSRHQDYRDAGAHHVVGLSDQSALALAILKETLYFPEFDPEEVEKVRTDLIEESERLIENNLEYVKTVFYNRAFAGHPYGRPTGGTAETLAGVSVDDLQAFHDRNWTPDRTVVSVVGDVDPEEIAGWVAAHWSDVEGSRGEVVRISPGPWAPPTDLQLLDLGKDQWTVNWGRPGVPMGDPDYFDSVVLSSIAGNDHFYKYVYEEGVSYRSWISFWPSWGAGAWILENDVQRERFDDILVMFDEDLVRYASDGFPRDEFDAAVQRRVKRGVLGNQNNQRMAWRLAVAEGNDVGFRHVTEEVDRYRAVEYDDVQALAADVFRPDAILKIVQK
jgi:zinc protease